MFIFDVCTKCIAKQRRQITILVIFTYYKISHVYILILLTEKKEILSEDK